MQTFLAKGSGRWSPSVRNPRAAALPEHPSHRAIRSRKAALL